MGDAIHEKVNDLIGQADINNEYRLRLCDPASEYVQLKPEQRKALGIACGSGSPQYAEALARSQSTRWRFCAYCSQKLHDTLWRHCPECGTKIGTL